MHKGRMEAFTDGVIAVIITIMVLVAVLWFVPDRRFEKVVTG